MYAVQIVRKTLSTCASSHCRLVHAAMVSKWSGVRDTIHRTVYRDDQGRAYIKADGLELLWDAIRECRDGRIRTNFSEFMQGTACKFKFTSQDSAPALYHPNVMLLILYDCGLRINASNWETFLKSISDDGDCNRSQDGASSTTSRLSRQASTDSVAGSVASCGSRGLVESATRSRSPLHCDRGLQVDEHSSSAPSRRFGAFEARKALLSESSGANVEVCGQVVDAEARRLIHRQQARIDQLLTDKRMLNQRLRRQKRQSETRVQALEAELDRLRNSDDFTVQRSADGRSGDRKWSWLTPMGIVNVGAS